MFAFTIKLLSCANPVLFSVLVVVLLLAIRLFSCANPLVLRVAPNTLLLLISAFTVTVPAACMKPLL